MKTSKSKISKMNFFEFIPPELNLYYYKKVFKKLKLKQTQQIIIPIILKGENLIIATVNLKVSSPLTPSKKVIDNGSTPIFCLQVMKQKHVHSTSLLLVNSKSEIICNNYQFIEDIAPRKPKKKSGGSKYSSIVRMSIKLQRNR